MKEGSSPLVGVHSWGCFTFLNMGLMGIKCYLLLRTEHPDRVPGGEITRHRDWGLRCC